MSCQDTTGYERSDAMIEEIADRVSRLELNMLEVVTAVTDIGVSLRRLKRETEIIRIEQK